MAKAYVDTTILTDVLLKTGEAARSANAAIKRFSDSELPVYAIKEFKSGPLRNFAWMHNKFAQTASYKNALKALQRMSLTPKRYTTATAIEALSTAAHSLGSRTGPALAKKYGPRATLDSMLADEYRLALKSKIFLAWRRRRSVTTKVVQSLPCYPEVAPIEKRGLIEVSPAKCDNSERECCLASPLKGSPEVLKALRAACDLDRREGLRRSKVLRQLIRKPKVPMTDRMCFDLGDAVFAFFAPDDATIISTNLKDHEALAGAIGKKVEGP